MRMNVFDVFRRQTYQRSIDEDKRKQTIKQALVQCMAEGKGMEGVLIVYLKNSKIHVMEGGLNDDFEAQALMQRAIYLINRDGLVMP